MKVRLSFHNLFFPSLEPFLNFFDFLLTDITKIFEECFIFSMKSIGIDIQELTPHSKMTLNYLIDSIKVTHFEMFKIF